MVVKVATSELLLDALLENPKIKAALLVDERGYVIHRRGAAASLKAIGDDDPTTAMRNPTQRKAPSENLYLVQAQDDFLIVVFDDQLNFERIKESVDSVLAKFDMAPDEDGDE